MTGAAVTAAASGAAFVLVAAAVRAEDRRRVASRAGLPPPGRLAAHRLRAGAPVVHLALCGVSAWAGDVAAGAAGAIVAGIAAAAFPRALARRQESRRIEAMDEQLCDAVGSISAAIRAGMSTQSALAHAAGEVGDPLATTLRDVARRSALGEPFAASLAWWTAQVGTAGARLVATVLELHHTAGGDAPRVLDRLGSTLRDRADGVRELRTLTAQARLSGTILGVLPIAFFLFLTATSRDDIAAAYRSSVGVTAIAVGLGLQGVAFLWIRSLLRVER